MNEQDEIYDAINEEEVDQQAEAVYVPTLRERITKKLNRIAHSKVTWYVAGFIDALAIVAVLLYVVKSLGVS